MHFYSAPSPKLTLTNLYDLKETPKLIMRSRPHTGHTYISIHLTKFLNVTLMVTFRCFGGNKVSPPKAFTSNQLKKLTKTLNLVNEVI